MHIRDAQAQAISRVESGPHSSGEREPEPQVELARSAALNGPDSSGERETEPQVGLFLMTQATKQQSAADAVDAQRPAVAYARVSTKEQEMITSRQMERILITGWPPCIRFELFWHRSQMLPTP